MSFRDKGDLGRGNLQPTTVATLMVLIKVPAGLRGSRNWAVGVGLRDVTEEGFEAQYSAGAAQAMGGF